MRLKVIFFIILVTMLLSLPRFAHHTPDSAHYIALARFFRGDVGAQGLVTPYAYRVLLPFLAALGPTRNLDWNVAVINLVFVLGAYLVFYLYLKRILGEEAEVNLGMLLLVISFPTVNYASGVLTDPTAFFFFVVAIFLLLEKRFLLFSVTASVGVLARESNLSLVLVFVLYLAFCAARRALAGRAFYLLCCAALPVATHLIVRLWCQIEHIGGHFWYPSLRMLVNNLTEPVVWATIGLTLLPLALLCVIGFVRARSLILADLVQISISQRALLLAIAIAGVLVLLFGIITVFASGRYAWPLYTALVPFTVFCVRRTTLFTRWLRPFINWLFGPRQAE